jgi:hypothetical protein
MFHFIIFITVLCFCAINATPYMMCDVSSGGYMHQDSKGLNTTKTIKLELYVGKFDNIKDKVCRAYWFTHFNDEFFHFSDTMNLFFGDDIFTKFKFEHTNKQKYDKVSKQVSKHVNDFRNSNSQIYSNQDMFLKNTEVDQELAFDGDSDEEDDEEIIEL